MSFELHFLPRPDHGDWTTSVDPATHHFEGFPTNRDLVMWERVAHRLEVEMPNFVRSTVRGDQAYVDAEFGLELTLSAEAIVLRAPGDRTGLDELVLIDLLRRTAAIVETVTALVAYDRTARARFLHDVIERFEANHLATDHLATDDFATVPAQLRALAR